MYRTQSNASRAARPRIPTLQSPAKELQLQPGPATADPGRALQAQRSLLPASVGWVVDSRITPDQSAALSPTLSNTSSPHVACLLPVVIFISPPDGPLPACLTCRSGLARRYPESAPVPGSKGVSHEQRPLPGFSMTSESRALLILAAVAVQSRQP
ncbi:uncharacterized protein B0I36DRAFT_393250 [Microdochium trichocladiopsis]|uniref:Uncharacterized protein n=1 Tax=Microdochium trichocladiopsis TaxID=1682393 RepID=A0A9P8XVM9_9PEZI|nr:uncharacterized protein B0I36DRAFT_393250 [Microdochium trichocladiopsis]KAH7020989.1 hypothetical protein B0I36DRAFT_393250 [Microdochium trichocladiopsis]